MVRTPARLRIIWSARGWHGYALIMEKFTLIADSVANRGCFCGAPLHEAYALGRAPLLVAAEGCFSAAPKSANVLNRTGRNNLAFSITDSHHD